MAEAPRNRLPLGHDEEYVSEVDEDFLCLICHLPLMEPVLTRCGHRFCKECLEEHLRRQEVQTQRLFTCPADRVGLDRDRDIFPDKATERKVLSFAIKCPSENCGWTGELRNKEVHLQTCPSKVVSCTNENCHMTLKRTDLEQHVTTTCEWRIIECEYCREPHPECQMQNHIEKCNKFPLACPKSCGDSIPREVILNHIENDCPLTLVSCPYVQMGCNEKVHRKSVSSHLQLSMEEHLDFACVKLNKAQVLLNETQVQLDETQAQLSLTQDQLSNTQETTRKLEEKVAALQRQMKLKEKTERATHDQLSNTQKTTKNLEEKVAALQRQLELKEKTERSTQYQLNNTQGITKKLTENVAALQLRLEQKENTDRLTQNQLRSLEEKVAALQLLQLQLASGKNDMQVVQKITNFTETFMKAYQIREVITFSSGYMEPFGYKFHLLAYPDGTLGSNIRNPQISVGIGVIEGEYDAMLAWPFNKKVTFTLIDQQEDPEERQNVVNYLHLFLQRPKGAVNPEGWIPGFISLENLYTRRYIVDDTLFLQVEVSPP